MSDDTTALTPPDVSELIAEHDRALAKMTNALIKIHGLNPALAVSLLRSTEERFKWISKHALSIVNDKSIIDANLSQPKRSVFHFKNRTKDVLEREVRIIDLLRVSQPRHVDDISATLGIDKIILNSCLTRLYQAKVLDRQGTGIWGLGEKQAEFYEALVNQIAMIEAAKQSKDMS